MWKAILSICLLLALLSPVTSLTCSYCRSNETSCPARSVDVCNSTEICTSAVLDNLIDYEFTMFTEEYKKVAIKGCAARVGCHTGDYSISSANGKYLQAKVFCCGTKECNREDLFVIPRKDIPPNGLECPACFGITKSIFDPICENQGTVSCRGNETKCIDLTCTSIRITFLKDIKLQGCATEDVCALNGKTFIIDLFHLEKIAIQCSDAKKSAKLINSQ